jgi:hypothetical protein
MRQDRAHEWGELNWLSKPSSDIAQPRIRDRRAPVDRGEASHPRVSFILIIYFQRVRGGRRSQSNPAQH